MGVRRIVFSAVAAVMALTAGKGAYADPLEIRIGWTAVPIEMMPIAFQNKAILPHLGKSYEPILVHFNGSGPLLSAFATGDVDIGSLSPPAFGSAILNGGLTQLRVVADGFQDGVRNHTSIAYLVGKDSPIKTVDDLKGKVLAVNAFGGAADIAMRAMMSKHHMTARRSYTAIDAPFPSMAAMLMGKKVDLAAAVPPFTYVIIDRGIGRVLFTSRDAIGSSQAIFLVMRADFIAKHRQALVDFFEDYIRALHWYFNPANRQKAIGIVSGFTKQPKDVFANWAFTEKDFYHDPNAIPNLKMLQRNIETDKELGFLKSALDVKEYADLSLVKAAGERLR